jgi:drug/metabolite transporter (DMT)-like permease
VGGIVLLVLIGLIVAWLVTRGRQKMKLPVTGKHWAWIIVAVVVVLAIAYGASGHVSPH